MNSLVNDVEKVDPQKENAEVFEETLALEELRKEVIERLEWIEKNDTGQFWWEDKPLINLFMTLYKCGCILLPKKPVERLRWIALLCLEISNLEEFDCGNIIIPLDFLPDSLLFVFEEPYGRAVMEGVLNLREQLSTLGWEAVFPE